jgi:hypothetical protein
MPAARRGCRVITHLPQPAGVAAVVVVVATLLAGCGPQAQSEFGGDGWYQGRVLVCKTAGHCHQLPYPTPQREPVYVELRLASTGAKYGGLAVDNDGTFGWWAAPGTYKATLEPDHLYGLRASTARVTITANGRTAFNLAYGRQR